MKRISILLCFIMCTLVSLLSQEKLELRLVPTNVSESSEILCFDTQFKNISDKKIKLAGQNYRLFYDALQLKFTYQSDDSGFAENQIFAISGSSANLLPAVKIYYSHKYCNP